MSSQISPLTELADLVDLRVERELLATHDVARMHERLQRALRRRLVARAAGVATLVCLALGVALSLFWPRAAALSPPCPCDSAATTTTAATPPVPVPAAPVPVPAAPALAPERPFLPLSASESSERGPGGEDLSVKPRTAPSPPPRVPTNAIAPPAVAEPGRGELPLAPIVEGEGSTLKKQLRLYDDAKGSLADDPASAAALAHDLRARFPVGPLAVEAGLLEVRALATLGRVDDARSLLLSLEEEAGERGKRAAWKDLRASLPVLTSPDERSRVIE